MPAIETAAMPKVAGMARSYGPACTTKQAKDFHIKTPPSSEDCTECRNNGPFET